MRRRNHHACVTIAACFSLPALLRIRTHVVARSQLLSPVSHAHTALNTTLNSPGVHGRAPLLCEMGRSDAVFGVGSRGLGRAR